MLRIWPTDSATIEAPGAAPDRVRSGPPIEDRTFVGTPATMPATWVPCPPVDAVSLSLLRTGAQHSSIPSVGAATASTPWQTDLRLTTTLLLPSGRRKNG